MRLMQRLAGLLVFFALSATLLIRIDPAFAQGSIADSGLQILQGLSSEQRDAISQQLGGAGLGGQQGTIGARQQPTNEVQQSLMLQQQRELLMDSQKQRAEMQRLSPFLQGEDWVVITVDSNPLPVGNQAPTATPQAGTLGALGGVTNAQQQNILGNLAPALAASQGGQSGPGAGTGGAGQSGVAAATAAAMTPSPAQNVTAGGYALMPPSCSGQPNCDPSQPTRPELTDEEKKQRQVLIDLIRSKNPYQLSRDGVLALPGFAPIPLLRLPFPSIVVASSNDPFVTIARAQTFASAWGGEFVTMGEVGHINTASGLGAWPEGLALLRNFRETQQLKSSAARRHTSLRVL